MKYIQNYDTLELLNPPGIVTIKKYIYFIDFYNYKHLICYEINSECFGCTLLGNLASMDYGDYVN